MRARTPAQARRNRWIAGLALVLVGSCSAINNAQGYEANAVPSAVQVSTTDSATARDTTEPVEATSRCFKAATGYIGEDGCYPGGELVTVRRVVDGDTVELADGRKVRFLGIDTPEANTCAGPGATAFTQSLVGGKTVKLHKEPGVDVDRYGRTLAYLQTDGPHYTHDVGLALIRGGWAVPYDGDANAGYMRRATAMQPVGVGQGQFAPPCGAPPVPAPDVRVDVDRPHVNLPDGALTGGFCRGKWYC